MSGRKGYGYRSVGCSSSEKTKAALFWGGLCLNSLELKLGEPPLVGGKQYDDHNNKGGNDSDGEL